MIDFRNPYTPGAGKMPKYLAGRDSMIDDAKMKLRSMASGYQSRSTVYYGLRGVGKTVLLNAVGNTAQQLDILKCHIEVNESSNFIKSVSTKCNGFVKMLSVKETIKDTASKLIAVAKCFSATWNPEDKTFSVEFNEAKDEAMSGTGDLANDLTELMVSLGQYAAQANSSICFCIDEVQYAKENELEAMITAVHRIDQLGLPIIFFCAGLPKVLKAMGDAKSYSERLFDFMEVGSLSAADARDAIIQPAKSLTVEYEDEAVERIIEITKGYPYFIQEVCNTVWKRHSERYITQNAVNEYLEEAIARLDTGFFKVRYDRCTPTEKKFIAAMVKCGELPCNIANVATILNKRTKSISPIRGQLIDKGLIYATSHGEIDFTVPQFDDFIKRHHPDFQK